MQHLFVLTPHGQQVPRKYSTQTPHYAIEMPEDGLYRLKHVVLKAIYVTVIVIIFVVHSDNKIIVVKDYRSFKYPTNFLLGLFRR